MDRQLFCSEWPNRRATTMTIYTSFVARPLLFLKSKIESIVSLTQSDFDNTEHEDHSIISCGHAFEPEDMERNLEGGSNVCTICQEPVIPKVEVLGYFIENNRVNLDRTSLKKLLGYTKSLLNRVQSLRTSIVALMNERSDLMTENQNMREIITSQEQRINCFKRTLRNRYELEVDQQPEEQFQENH